MASCPIVVADSVTALGIDADGAIVIAASHGGVYAVHVALQAGARGLILSDAGVGLDAAGISGLAYCDRLDVPCATVGYASARIGDGADCSTRGVLSHVNDMAAGLGIRVGMGARGAAELMCTATPTPRRPSTLPNETRRALGPDPGLPPGSGRRQVWLVDSASLVRAGDAGSVVVTGSHGGLLGGREESALKAPVFAAVFNDAGVGMDRAGIGRLPALDKRGIAAATASAATARIGDAGSAYDTGQVSFVNDCAARRGASPGMSVRFFVRLMTLPN